MTTIPTNPVRTLALALLFVCAAPLVAQHGPSDDEKRAEELAAYVRAHYTKTEHRVPMRDGVELFTSVYAPNEPGKASYPILMLRTPYGVGPYGADRYRRALGPTEDFDRDKYIFVYQDVRGRYLSEGTFVNMRPHRATKSGPEDVDESTDTWDTIEWLIANVPRNSGRVGQWGISYPGFYTAAGMIDSHPALKAASPQAPIADWFWDDMHHHGAFILPLAFNFFSSFGKPRPEPTTERAERFDHGTVDGYRFFLELGPLANVDERHFKGEIEFWQQIVAHPNYDDFWQSRNLLPHLDGITAAVMVVGGWFDAEDLYGPLKIYRAVERNNPGIFNMLVMGPWRHGGWARTDGRSVGTADFGFATSEHYREHLIRPFFRHFLKGEGELELPEAMVFETGANRWRSFDAWPPEGVREAYLYPRADGALAFTPAEDEGDVHDAFPSDPKKPVPYTMNITTRWEARYMTEDQRFAAWRPDVLVYETEILTDDVTVAGPLEADLWVSTTGSAADWVVKLIDVHPGELPELEDQDPDRVDPARRALGGQQMLIRGEVIRGRFRDSYEHPKPFVPNEPTRVRFELQDVLHTFKRGHRIMIHVQSTWFPLVDRNPQTYVPNIFAAEESDFVAATHRLYRSRARPSRIRIGILD